MALTTYVELRDGERQDVAGAFMLWCRQRKQIVNGGCHEGDAGGFPGAVRYAAIPIPDHNPDLIGYLHERAVWEGRRFR
jgi:hypothetical protein